jgi:uncharacterized protein (TIRG00374 family)
MTWRIARAVFAAAAAILLIRLVPPGDVLDVLAGGNPGWLIVAAILLSAATALGTISFRRLLAARGVRARFGAVLMADLAGHFYSLSLPGGVAIGGAMRLLRLSGPRASMAAVLSAIIASRLLDVVCGVLVAIVAFALIAQTFEDVRPWIGLLGAILLVALLAYGMATSRGVRLWTVAALARNRRLPPPLRRFARVAVLRLARTRRIDPRAEFPTIICLIARHLVGGAALAALLWAVHVDVSYGAALWARVVTGLAMLLPLSVAGLGIREASLILLLAPFGVASASAVAISLMLLCYQLLLGAVGGLIELAAGLAPMRTLTGRRGPSDRGLG